MNMQRFLQGALDIGIRRKKQDFVQQILRVRPLPIGIIDIQRQRRRETSRQLTDRIVAGLKLSPITLHVDN